MPAENDVRTIQLLFESFSKISNEKEKATQVITGIKHFFSDPPASLSPIQKKKDQLFSALDTTR